MEKKNSFTKVNKKIIYLQINLIHHNRTYIKNSFKTTEEAKISWAEYGKH